MSQVGGSLKMSGERIVCSQFNQHAWKRDICKNCSRHLTCHDVKYSNRDVKANLSGSVACDKDDTVEGHSNTKPNISKKSFCSRGNISKSISNVKKPTVIAEVELEEGINSIKNSRADYGSGYAKDSGNYYQIYDISAKGQSGKPVDLVSQDSSSNFEKCIDSQNAHLMATPYTVVDVIAMALEKTHQPDQLCSAPPCLPTTPAPDIKTAHSSNKDVTVFENKLSRFSIEEKIDSYPDLHQLHNYHPRVYEEIDDTFLEKIAFKKLGLNSEDEVNKNDKIADSSIVKTMDLSLNKSSNELNHKTFVKQDKSKKSGGKTFFQKLLGKSSKDEELCKSKMERNGKKDYSADEKNLPFSEDEVKLLESLMIDMKSKKEAGHKDDAGKSSSEMLNPSSCIGEDFAKEIEEKFETLSRKSNFTNTEAMKRSISNKPEISIDCDEPQNKSFSTQSTSDGIASTLPNRKLAHISKKADSLTNRRSMTPAEAKLARKMMVAPPPPPICTSSTSLASVTSHSVSGDDDSKCSGLLPSHFMSLQRRPLQSQIQDTALMSHTPGDDGFESSDASRNSLMDDLDEILKKGGMTGTPSTLPKSFLLNEEKTVGKANALASEVSSKNVVQQRALPELPQLPPPKSRLHKTNLSPETENFYESLPLTDNLSPSKSNFCKELENSPITSPVRFDGNINAGPSFKSKVNQIPSRPRPAPRAAIRTASLTKHYVDISSKALKERSYAVRNKVPIKQLGNFRLHKTLEEKHSIISELTLQSLQMFLDKFSTLSTLTSFPMRLFFNVPWKQKEADIVKIAECSNPILIWKKAVFYEVIINDFNCILMVRDSSALTSPIPKYDHPNLINTIHSFEAQAELQDCQGLFQPQPHEIKLVGKLKYRFDVLPYSKISIFSSSSLGAEISSVEFSLSPHDFSKCKVYTLLQIFDSVLHLQKLGIDAYRLHPGDILLTAPITNAKSCKIDLSSCSLPVLVPTEYGNSPGTDWKLLYHDLTKITSIISISKCPTKSVPQTKQPETARREDTRTVVSQPCSQTPQPKTRQVSIMLDKNDRCLRKLECILGDGESWKQAETAIKYMEFSLWGPPEEEVKTALMSPKRKEIFDWWVSASRAETLVDLMQDPILAYLLQHPGHINKIIQGESNKVNQDPATEISLITWLTNTETLRRAKFLKCDLETLLDSAEALFL